jgi:hypothetical protein
VLASTHARALDFVPLAWLQRSAAAPSPPGPSGEA